MYALRCLLLLIVVALSLGATTVTPSAGSLAWVTDNATKTGWFEVRVRTNTPTSQIPDYIRLDSVSLVIDLVTGPDQIVDLFRTESQSLVGDSPSSNNTDQTSLYPESCSDPACPPNSTRYFSQAFTATTQILAATLSWIPVAGATPLHDPYWRYKIGPVSGMFAADLSPLVNRAVLVNSAGAGTPFVYDQAYSKTIRLTGVVVPEPSTVILSGLGLMAVIACRRTRRGTNNATSC